MGRCMKKKNLGERDEEIAEERGRKEREELERGRIFSISCAAPNRRPERKKAKIEKERKKEEKEKERKEKGKKKKRKKERRKRKEKGKRKKES